MDVEETTTSTPVTPTTTNRTVIRLSDGVRIAGLVLCSMSVALAVVLGGWVIWNRKASVVQMMQPVFLLMLCVGCTISSLAIIPLGANDINTTHCHINTACLAWVWLRYLGPTISLSALFSKLWRVNEIFHANGFQRKIVTIRDALIPFGILVSINTTLLLILSFVDPPVWQEFPITTTTQTTTTTTTTYYYYGQCEYTTDIGILLDLGLGIMTIVPLIILCVQAYRARDINSDFSEARGAALAVFLWLQSIVITIPTEEMIGESNIDAQYTLTVTSTFVHNTSLLFFIFAPIIAHHRQRQRNGDKSVTAAVTSRISNNNHNNDGSSGYGPRKTKCRISGLNMEEYNYPPPISSSSGGGVVDPLSSALAFGGVGLHQQPQTTQKNSTVNDDGEQQLPTTEQEKEKSSRRKISELELELQDLRSRIQEMELVQPIGAQEQEQQLGSKEETKQRDEEAVA